MGGAFHSKQKKGICVTTTKGSTAMTIKHLESDTINDIALGLDEDIYGANGDLDQFQIRERIVENIHGATNHQYATSGLVPVGTVAGLILSIWEYKDRQVMEEIGRINQAQKIDSPIDVEQF
jgi:hypothetical protein